ncbi:MAG TPA: alpha/beta hydrolase [Candidatus Saccharimonadales bacterium]|nr:alpha/beta hydrolase [Candidatus Saccharimonadales bacterium]
MVKHLKTTDTDYWVYNNDPKLPVIVMIHGLRGTHHGLDLIAKPLTKYRVIVPDLPGFGISKPFENEHYIENYVKWLKKFMTNLKLKEPPILLGHSFGSIIVGHFAKENPNMVSKLILVNPIGVSALEGSKAILTQIAVLYYWLSRVLSESAGTKLLSTKFCVMAMSITLAKTRDKEVRAFIHDQHLQHFSEFANRRVANEAFKASIHENVRDVASGITVPTLLIAGELDDITPLKKQRELVILFPNAKLEVINEVGHLTHYETPEKIVELIEKFTG